MRLCVFDLDHTLVQTPLDLAAMALDMRATLERAADLILQVEKAPLRQEVAA